MKLAIAILLAASTVAIAQNVTAPAHPPYTKNLAQPVAQTKPVHTLSQTLAPMVTARAFVLAVASNQDVKDCTDQEWPSSVECNRIALAIMRTFVKDKVAGKETPKVHTIPIVAQTATPQSTEKWDATGTTFTTTNNALTFSEEHGCNYATQWDENKKVYSLHFLFSSDMTPPITCSSITKDENGYQSMICWYSPKAAQTEAK